MHDDEVRSVDPACFIDQDPDTRESLVEAAPVTIIFERGGGWDESDVYGRIMEAIEKQQKHAWLWTGLAFTAMACWSLRHARRC